MNRTAAIIGLALSLSLHSGLLLFSARSSLPIAMSAFRVTLQPVKMADPDSEKVLPRPANNLVERKPQPAPEPPGKVMKSAGKSPRRAFKPPKQRSVQNPPPSRKSASEIPVAKSLPVAEVLPNQAAQGEMTQPDSVTTIPVANIQPATPAVPPSSFDADAQNSAVKAEGDKITPPSYIPSARPYPPLAKQRGWEGSVTLQASIGAGGRVKQVELQQSSGYPVLDRAALRHIRKSRFHPALKDGQPVEMTVRVPVVFELK